MSKISQSATAAQAATLPAQAGTLPAQVQVAVRPLPLRQVLPWLLLFGLLAAVTMYFVSTEQGAVSLMAGSAVHEWLHDGRHLLGFPCH